MKIADIVADNTREELSRLKKEYKRLKSIGYPQPPKEPNYDNLIKQMQQKVNAGELSIDEYTRWAKQLFAPSDLRREKWKKAHRAYSAKMSQLINRIEELRGQISYYGSIGTPSGMFANRETDPYLRNTEHYFDPLGKIINKANEELPIEAETLVQSFVGHSSRPIDGEIGVWDFKRLENAIANNSIGAQQLYSAMQPIRELLRQRFGNTIRLYRAQYRLTGNEPTRRVLSWTASPIFAKNLSGRDNQYRDLLSIDMPLERIIWITNRANQQEFICLS